MPENKRWVITTSGNQSIKKIKENLIEKGFEIDLVLDEIGCIIGSASNDVAENLLEIQGVEDVSPEETIDIGPPDSPETW